MTAYPLRAPNTNIIQVMSHAKKKILIYKQFTLG